jgi:hypothetical protein
MPAGTSMLGSSSFTRDALKGAILKRAVLRKCQSP